MPRRIQHANDNHPPGAQARAWMMGLGTVLGIGGALVDDLLAQSVLNPVVAALVVLAPMLLALACRRVNCPLSTLVLGLVAMLVLSTLSMQLSMFHVLALPVLAISWLMMVCGLVIVLEARAPSPPPASRAAMSATRRGF